MHESGRDLRGRIGVVTGGGSGIGRASAIALAAAGAHVVVSDVDEPGGAETVRRIIGNGGQASFHLADVTSAEDVAGLFRHVAETHGRLDFAHNNGGIEGRIASVADYAEDDWQRVIDVNLTGVWRCMREELRIMQEQGGGVIVNTASISGMTGFPPLLPAYVASKFGVAGLTRAAARHYAGSNIRINAVCPGAIETPMLDRIGEETARLGVSMVAENPSGRRGQPSEVGAAVAWLCSDSASFINGHLMVVDGGFLA